MSASLSRHSDENSAASHSVIAAANTEAPDFDFCDFFHGHTRVSGWFSDPFGKPKRHFCGDFFGQYDNDRYLLDEKLFYTDGVVESRVWEIEVTDSGIFTAHSDSLIDGAHGLVKANTLTMKYSMQVKIAEGKHWKLDMKDQMILQPDGSLHNITHVHKWGLRIGTVSAQYLHHDGDQLCINALAGKLSDKKQLVKGAAVLSSVDAG